MTRLSILTLPLLSLTAAFLSPVASAADADSAAFYKEKVLPILEASCFECHGPKSELKGGLFLGNREGFLEGGESGPAIDPDALGESIFLDAINYESYEMPPKRKLPDNQIAILTEWVKAGASIPSDAEFDRPEAHKRNPATLVTDETKNYWAFRPVENSPVPDVNNASSVSNPIDNFILQKLEAANLSPASAASKQKLIRRATYDLTGLPPSIADIDAFVNDKSDRAFEKVIDRLLESPQYGERWGRHWLDLVRYAESNSYERDDSKPFAWRYRDYVINSFNADKPYTQFIKEQLAGDEFEPRTPDSIVATGYYRLGIWDDEPVSQQQALYDDLDDILLTTSQVFLGLTMNCARCHDHKIDPIPQKDYYSFLAFFNGVQRYGVRGYPSVEDASIGPIAVNMDEEDRAALRKQLDRELDEHHRKIDFVERKLHELLTPPEKEDFKATAVRVDLARKYAGKGIAKKLVEEYETAVARKREIEDSRPAELAQALMIKEIGATPRDTFILVRGNANVEGEKVEPAFPSVLSPPQPVIKTPASGKSSGRRTALANWIASEDNPLTARVMVNRIWQHHFGRGIVGSSNNFGNIGDKPTHPELLDWLATRFMQDGWKLKSMHKLIMLSSTYQLSSQASDKELAADPANNLYWRFNMRRLSSEELRDSVHAANGSLNLKMGGPSVYPIIPQEVLAGQSRPGAGWGNSSVEEQARRAVYIFIKRSLVEPLMADFDFADVDSTCPVRFVTTQPTQALSLLNSEFMNRQATVFAEFLRKQVGDDTTKQVELGLSRITQRRPTRQEVDRGVELIESLKKDGVPADHALNYYCLALYNLNEFLYLD
ncbi:MAG: DUF1553 domain-containing protein [Rhodopirellula sp.]|nr:DUF1553 domain-containing protein [Rhodopirellula sp.]